MCEKIGSSVNYGGIELKNPVIFAPTSMGLSEEELLKRYQRIAAGGCAMIIIGDVPVKKSRFVPSLQTKKGFDFYRRLTELVHKENCKICAQLHQSDSNLKAMLKYIPGVLTKKIGPDDLRRLLNQEVGPYITGLSETEIHRIVRGFGDTAVLAKNAGFDMIQVHGDRMCGSFSSEIFNGRKDCYGGSPENRARFACEAVSAVREAVPGMSVDYKLAVRQENPHDGNAGVLKEELGIFVPLLEKAGVTSFHVTLANHGELSDTIPPVKHPFFSEEGCFLRYCDVVRKYTDLPVCGVGGLSSPEFVERQLASGRIQCAAMSRQLIADPEWVNKVLDGKKNEIQRCVRCNRECLGGMMEHRGVHCIYERRK